MSTGEMSGVGRTRWLRGGVLMTLNDVQANGGKTQHNNSTLWSLMIKLRFDASRNEITAVLQDLSRRGYLAYRYDKNETDGKVYLYEIEVTPKGGDLVESSILARKSLDDAIDFGPL